METTGRIKSIARDWTSNKTLITFELDSLPSDLADLQGSDALDITAQRHRKRRSRNANALLWSCIGKIAAVLRADKWDVYLKFLKEYGEYTYVCVKPQAVEMLKKQWRECEELGPININGEIAMQMLCYYGSSTYDTHQFTVLLDGVISEMKEIGLETPAEEELKRTLEAWDEQTKTH